MNIEIEAIDDAYLSIVKLNTLLHMRTRLTEEEHRRIEVAVIELGDLLGNLLVRADVIARTPASRAGEHRGRACRRGRWSPARWAAGIDPRHPGSGEGGTPASGPGGPDPAGSARRRVGCGSGPERPAVAARGARHRTRPCGVAEPRPPGVVRGWAIRCQRPRSASGMPFPPSAYAGGPSVAEQLHRPCDPVVKHFRGDLEGPRVNRSAKAASPPRVKPSTGRPCSLVSGVSYLAIRHMKEDGLFGEYLCETIDPTRHWTSRDAGLATHQHDPRQPRPVVEGLCGLQFSQGGLCRLRRFEAEQG